MKHITIIILGMSLAMTALFGQTSSDTISVEKAFGGYRFYQNAKPLGSAQLAQLMQNYEPAYRHIKSAQTSITIASVLGGVGGFMIGWPIGTALGGGKPNWLLAGIGGGLIAIGIPINNNANKKMKQAVDIYNGAVRSTSFWEKSEVKFALSENGIGLRIHF